MSTFLEKLFKKNRQPSRPQSFRIGVPADRIPQEFLEDLNRFFSQVQIVNRAAYGLAEINGKFSYVIYLDLEVAPKQQQDALQHITASISKYCKASYRGRWPLDFSVWDNDVIMSVISQDSSYEFFKKSTERSQDVSSQKARIAIPNPRISSEYLNKMKSQLQALGTVKRAAYTLMEMNGQVSYVVSLDLDTTQDHKEAAFNHAVDSLLKNSQIPYNGNWPLDFMLWNDALVAPILSQDPSFEFFKK